MRPTVVLSLLALGAEVAYGQIGAWGQCKNESSIRRDTC
jgi:hypothetical protein